MNSSKILSITEDTIKNMHKPFSGTDEYRTEPLKMPVPDPQALPRRISRV